MRTKYIFFALFLFVGITLAQGTLPTAGLKHHFKFDNPADLEAATVGNKLKRDVIAPATQVFNAVAGPTAGNGAVEVGLGSFYRLDLDFDPNGMVDTAKRVNQFAIVIDFYLPVSGVWYSFHASENDGDPVKNDWESFVNSSGQIGVGTTGYTLYRTPEKKWHRLVITADLGKYYHYYIDGQLARDGGVRTIDDRLSLPSIDGANQLLLLGDNDGEDANIYVSEIAVYNRPLTPAEIWAMGGFGNKIPLDVPYGQWLFDNPASPFAPTRGDTLKLIGNASIIPGSEPKDTALSLAPGSFLVANHNMPANGGGTRVNEYTMVADVRFSGLGRTYSLLQTNHDNTDAAEFIINETGKVGSSDLGFDDSTLVAGDWYRLAITADLDSIVKIFLDGDSVFSAKVDVVDGRFSINPRELANQVLFFADQNDKSGALDVAKLTLYNRTLTTEQIKALSGFTHGAPNTEVTGALKAVYFNGNDVNNKYGLIKKSNDDFNFGEGDFTLEMWVKPDLSYPSDPSLLSDKDWGSGGNPGWVISIRGDDWKFNAADAARNRYDVNGPNISDGNWHHIAVIAKQDSGVKLITDDLETIWFTQDGAFFKVANIDSPLPICVAQDGTQKYSDAPPAPAQIDEIRIWKGVAVDPTIVKSWRNKKLDPTHPNYANLVAYYSFNEGDGNKVNDLSGRNNHIELIGSPRWEVSYAAIANEGVMSSKDLNAIWGGVTTSSSGGLMLSGTFPFPKVGFALAPVGVEQVLAKEDNPYIAFGHNGQTTASAAGLPTGVVARLARTWNADQTETKVGNLSATFDISEYGGTGNAGNAADYVLLHSADGNTFTQVTAVAIASEDKITFSGIDGQDGYYTLGSKNLSTAPLGIAVSNDQAGALPKEFALSQNFPNPFNPSTTINFALPVGATVEVKVFDVLGQEVATLVNGVLEAGNHTAIWNASNATSGLYIYKIKAVGDNGKEFVKSHKMMLMK